MVILNLKLLKQLNFIYTNFFQDYLKNMNYLSNIFARFANTKSQNLSLSNPRKLTYYVYFVHQSVKREFIMLSCEQIETFLNLMMYQI